MSGPLSHDGATLRVQGLRVVHSSDSGTPVLALHDVSFDAAGGQVLGLLGPSGCGKTSALKAIAGLLKPLAGEIEFAGRVLFSAARKVAVPVEERRIALMFQSYAIWPHMTVLENALFPLRVGPDRVSESQATQLAGQALERMQLGGLAMRRATELSGGQQQRLALARVLAQRPRLLLLDEPLSNLEPSLRAHMTAELRTLQRETGLTVVVVTHDHDEAMALADRLVVMREGRVLQQGTPREVYGAPASAFVAQFLGRINLLTAAQYQALCGAEGAARRAGMVGLRHEDLLLSSERPTPAGDGTTPANDRTHQQAGRIERVTFLGDALEVELRTAHAHVPPLLARCSARQGALVAQVGQQVWLHWSAQDVHHFETENPQP